MLLNLISIMVCTYLLGNQCMAKTSVVIKNNNKTREKSVTLILLIMKGDVVYVLLFIQNIC